MTNATIPSLTSATALAGTELLEIVQPGSSSGSSKSATALQIANTAQGLLPAGGTSGQALTKTSSTDYATTWTTVPGTGTVTSVATNNGITGGPITTSGTVGLSLLGAVQYLGLASNNRIAKTTTYTVVNADKAQTIALGGTAFYTLTINAASGYDSNFAIVVLNEDATRGKTMAINGLASFILWPGQSIVVYNQNSAWHVLPAFQRWRLTSSTTIYTDFTNGADTNDGLAPGANNAMKTVAGALQNVISYFDFQSSPQSTVTIQMAASSTDTTNVHYAPHSLVGPQGGACVVIDGNGGTLSVAGNALELFFGAIVQIRRLTIVSASGNGLSLSYGAKAYILDGVLFGACPSSGHISLASGSYLNISNSYTISGAALYHLINANAIYDAASTVTISFTTDAAFTAFAYGNGTGAASSFAGVTFALGGHTITGTRFSQANNSTLTSRTGSANTFFPGDTNGTVTNGATVDSLMSTTLAQGGTNAATAPLARTQLGVAGYITHGDANVTLTAADCPVTVLTAGLSTTRTWTLPLAGAVQPGDSITILDAGGINGANTLTIQRQGADTFTGIGCSANAITMGTALGSITAYSNGAAAWLLASKNIS